MLVKAKYVERNIYEIEVEGIKENFVEPSLAIAAEYTSKIVNIVEKLNKKGINVREEQVWSVLASAAEEAGKEFPNFLNIGNQLF